MPQPETPALPDTAMPQPATSTAGLLSSTVRATAAAVAVVAVLGAAGIPWLLSSPSRISQLVARAVPGLRADVRFGTVRLGWLGPMVLEDVRVVPRDGSHEPITASRIEVGHGLAGILLSMGDLGRLRVEGLEARVVFDADRDSNLKSLFAAAADDAAFDGDGVPPRPPRRSAVRLQLDLVGALVRIEGPWAPEPWVSEPINARATLRQSASGPWSEWRIDPVQLLADARLEPAVAQGVLAYIAPVLADATRTGGRFSLRLDEATLPVGSPESGHLAGVLSMHAVDLGPGPLVSNVIEALPGRLPAPPVIRIADQSHVEFRLAEGRVWHKGLAFGFPLAKPGQRLDLQSSGSVGLRDKSLDLKLELPIPGDLPQDRPLLASLAGRTLAVRIGGELGAPRVNLDGTLRNTAGDVVAELVDRLRGAAGTAAPRRPPVTPLPPPGMRRPAGPPAPGWKPDAAATASSPPAASGDPGSSPAEGEGSQSAPGSVDSAAEGRDAGDRGQLAGKAGKDGGSETPGEGSAVERIKAALPADMKDDPAADAVIDLVGGVIGELAKRRAERQATEAANPQQPRRGRFLRRLAPPPPSAAPSQQPLRPVPAESSGN
jgi:hypothetical protein